MLYYHDSQDLSTVFSPKRMQIKKHFSAVPGKETDFVSRTFFPKISVNEDPVCGSAHCNFIPYWAKRLGKTVTTAYQASPRGGYVFCEDRGDRVLISGKAFPFRSSASPAPALPVFIQLFR